MSIEDNKRLVQQFFDALDRQDFGVVDQFCHDDFVFYSQVDKPKPGVSGLINSERSSFEAYESARFRLQQMVAEGDKVAAYLFFEGKNYIRATNGLEPTGKDVRISVLCLMTIKDGKIVEQRAHFDMADAMAQLTAD